MDPAMVKNKVSMRLHTFAQPTMGAGKRAQDVKKTIRTAELEVVRAAKFLRANIQDPAALVEEAKTHFDKLVELEDNCDRFWGIVSRAELLLPEPETGKPLAIDLKTRISSKYNEELRTRLHSVVLRHESGKKWKLDNDDDDVVVENEDEDQKYLKWRCPLSKTEVDQPMRNPKCGHSYNRNAVNDYVRKTHNPSCPVRGCKQLVTLNTLVPDEELEAGFARAQKHLQYKAKAGKKKPTKRGEDEEDDDKAAASAQKRSRKSVVDDDDA